MTVQIDPTKWKIKLPIFPPSEVLDNSQLTEYARCPRRGLYRYGMRRAFGGKSWSIQFGLAYHKYRETVEVLMVEEESDLTNEIHVKGIGAATEGWEDPPVEHKFGYLNLNRLMKTLVKAKARIINEKRDGKIVVTRTEDSFDLELPFLYCEDCGYTTLDLKSTSCSQCRVLKETIKLKRARVGGRVDQFITFVSLNNARMIRDFKSTSRMGPTYSLKFDPNSQFQGYTWSGEELSGQEFDGALIETVYNTKNEGPEIFQHYVQFSRGQQQSWLASVMIENQLIRSMWARVDELGYLAFPQRTNACGDFGGCGYREACLASSGWEIEQWMENYTMYSHWDFANPDGEESKT